MWKLEYDEGMNNVYFLGDDGHKQVVLMIEHGDKPKYMKITLEDGTVLNVLQEKIEVASQMMKLSNQMTCSDNQCNLVPGLQAFISRIQILNRSPIKFQVDKKLILEEDGPQNAEGAGKPLACRRQLVAFDYLIQADEQHAVRAINPNWLEKLTVVLQNDNISELLDSELSVVETDDNQFMVLDGNHRLKAISKIRSTNAERGRKYDFIPCKVYTTNSKSEQLLLAYKQNQSSQRALPPSDFDLVRLVRKIFNDEENQELTEIEKMDLLYKFNHDGDRAIKRSEKQGMQNCLFIGRLPEPLFTLVEEPLKAGIIKASTLAPVRNLYHEDLAKVLQAYKCSGYSRLVLLTEAGKFEGNKKRKNTKKKPQAEMSFSGGVIQISVGSKVISATSISVCGTTLNAGELQKAVQNHVTKSIETDVAITDTFPAIDTKDEVEVPDIFEFNSEDENAETGNKKLCKDIASSDSVQVGAKQGLKKSRESPAKELDAESSVLLPAQKSLSDADCEINEQRVTATTEYKLVIAPTVIEEGSYVVIKMDEKSKPAERTIPWIGHVKKQIINHTKVPIFWVFSSNNKFVVSQTSQSVSREKIVAKFTLFNVDINGIPNELLAKVKRLGLFDIHGIKERK